MLYLILVSLIWAFSFGLIKGQLTGLDPNLVAAIRLFLAWLVFLPFCRLRHCRLITIICLLAIGAIQYGVMYMAYTASFQYLEAYQVALFTIFTPIYVTLINDLLSGTFHKRFFYAASLAVFGTAIILYRDLHHDEFRTGFLLLQLANLCFAFGQIAYTRVMRHCQATDRQVFSLLYLGAVLSTLPILWSSGQWRIPSLSLQQLSALLYLGILASGVCFFLWNYGARKVNAGTLAVCNNLKIPLAIACSALVFGETVNWQQLTTGSVILLLALLLNWHIRR
ncbi:MAG: EamA family transporter [Desulfuromonas sp.]|nr:EamA family transporter [Desulfuromonas sp.]